MSGRCWAGVGMLGGVGGRAWGVRGACVGRVWGGAIRVGIARSALLSGYLGKSGHLPRLLLPNVLVFKQI